MEAGERRTRQDWARWIEGMLERRYPEAERVVLVLDNLNTHGIESLYATYEPRHARQLAQRLEIHYTPKHGSWLNIAEIELSALCGQLEFAWPGLRSELGHEHMYQFVSAGLMTLLSSKVRVDLEMWQFVFRGAVGSPTTMMFARTRDNSCDKKRFWHLICPATTCRPLRWCGYILRMNETPIGIISYRNISNTTIRFQAHQT